MQERTVLEKEMDSKHAYEMLMAGEDCGEQNQGVPSG